MGMDTRVAAVLWLAPAMGFTLAFVRIAAEAWGHARVGDALEGNAERTRQRHAVRPLRWSARILVSTHTY